MARPLRELVTPDWAETLADVEDQIHAIGDFLHQKLAGGHNYLSADDNMLRAFSRSLTNVQVLTVGQDPYPTPGHVARLPFSVAPNVRPIPHSLQNTYQELNTDLGIPPAPHGDLNAWFEQGVLLLNQVLTVSPGKAGSHRGRGWEAATAIAITTLAEHDDPLVAILQDHDAQSTHPLLGQTPVIASARPSPLSTYNGFFGSKPFSHTNETPMSRGTDPVSWGLSSI